MAVRAHRTRWIAAGTALAIVGAGGFAWEALSPDSAAAAECSAMNRPIHLRIKPANEANLLTPWQGEADKAAANHGFTVNRGAPFRAALGATDGLVAAHRLFKRSSGDFVWITRPGEIATAQSKYGYEDQGANFYVSPTAASCTTPVYRFLKGSQHRFAVSEADRTALAAAGWRSEGIAFHAPRNEGGEVSGPAPTTTPTTAKPTAKPSATPTTAKPTVTATSRPTPTSPGTPTATSPAGENTFTLVHIGDTQREVNNLARTPQFDNRLNWLAANKSALNLKFVWQSGDLQDWDDATHSHYERASNGLKILERAGIPYGLTPGNHDTAAVCPGGSACPGANTSVTVRNTNTFNSYYPTSRFKLAGTYEPGKVDNAYRTFSAGGLQWLVLNLELWARPGAIEWAKGVVAAHPHHNVIVYTHSYLEANGAIGGSNGGYGATSPQYVYDNLISRYPNIKFVFSGHVGNSAMRTDTGVNGNKIYSFLDCYHHPSTNPMRLLTFDVAAGTVKSKVYAPFTNETLSGAGYDISGVNWVR